MEYSYTPYNIVVYGIPKAMLHITNEEHDQAAVPAASL